MKIKRFQSTFTKMTVFYMVFGVIPLVIISFVFFSWYYKDVEESTINNYSQITEYVERNMSSVILKADDTTGYMYDFTIEKYEHLYEIIKDTSLESTQKRIFMNKMLQDMMIGNESISSLRFYTVDGEVYTLFRGQGKSQQDERHILNEIEMTEENMHSMFLMPAVSEQGYYTNTEDIVFSVARNYRNTTNVKSIQEEQLGTLYVDINVEALGRLVETVEVGELGNIHVVNPFTNQWLYSTDDNAYGNQQLSERMQEVETQQIFREGKYWYFSRPIEDTGYYVVIQVYSEDVLNTYMKNRTFILAILFAVVLIMSLAYVGFSGKMSDPVRKLQKAMQQVQTGNMDVRVDIHTNDELEYLSDGFNKMVKDLSYYIEEMYVAQICQKEAELNALKMQIQPHYLYNTLDVIRMTAVENKDEKTARLLESLARNLRYVIGQQRERVPIYMELDSIREYFVLMNARYQDKFQLNVNVSDKDRNLYVLKLLLQPAVENCIKHGLKDKEGIGTIEVNVKRLEDCLEIVVMDDGVGMSGEEVAYIREELETKEEVEKKGEGRVSIGFKNVYDRIKLSCGEAYGFTLDSYENVGTMVKFRLPLWEEENDVEDDNR